VMVETHNDTLGVYGITVHTGIIFATKG
jgi:hypothetical protein